MVTNPRETRMPLRSIDKPSSVRSWSVNPESGSLDSAAPRSLAINAAAARLSSSDLPAPTSLIACASSMPSMSLTTYPLAPARIASSIASSEVYEGQSLRRP